MCTSIAVYKAKSIYAMNFDFFEVESRIRISNSGSVRAFFYEIKQGEEKQIYWKFKCVYRKFRKICLT